MTTEDTINAKLQATAKALLAMQRPMPTTHTPAEIETTMLALDLSDEDWDRLDRKIRQALVQTVRTNAALSAALQLTEETLEMFTEKHLKEAGLNIVVEQIKAALRAADGEVQP